MKRVKNKYPTNVKRNNYIAKPKENVVLTPCPVANRIFEIVDPVMCAEQRNVVIDVGCNTGNLSLPFKQAKYHCVGYDRKKVKYHSKFTKLDFLKSDPKKLFKDTHKEVYKICKKTNKAGGMFIICNPPFNDPQREYGRQLLPELFLRRIFDNWGVKFPVIFFSPMGLLKNQRKNSDRWKWIRDCGAEITSELELPIDAYIPEGNEEKYNVARKKMLADFKEREKTLKKFADTKKKTGMLDREKMFEEDRLKKKYKIILVHSSVLFFNIPGLKAKYFLRG